VVNLWYPEYVTYHFQSLINSSLVHSPLLPKKYSCLKQTFSPASVECPLQRWCWLTQTTKPFRTDHSRETHPRWPIIMFDKSSKNFDDRPHRTGVFHWDNLMWHTGTQLLWPDNWTLVDSMRVNPNVIPLTNVPRRGRIWIPSNA